MPITKRGRKWQATVNHKGERYRRTFDVYADAETWEAQTKLDLRAGRPVDLGESTKGVSTGVTLSRLREETLTHHWASVKDKRGPDMNTRMVIDMLGPDLPVTKVNARRVEDMILKLTQMGNSDSTINRKLSALSTMLKYAVKHQYIPTMPAIPRRKEPENRIRWMTDEEEAEMLAFFQYIGQEDMEDFVKVALDTGLRRGEMLRVQARDVHQQKLHVWESKSGKSRSVPLTKRAAAVLGKRINRTEHPTDKLFGDWSEDSLRHYWDRARHHLGLMRDPQFGIHVMRHTFCSRLAMKGVPMPAIKELAGHSSIVTTQRYVHMSPDSLSDAIGTLEKDSGLRSADHDSGVPRGMDSGVALDSPVSGYSEGNGINGLGRGFL